jgi:hypothetical protein
VNFVGHAHVALALRPAPAFVLGAMLPDFASMCRARIRIEDAPENEPIAAGVALHHATDDAFHSAPEFIALCVATSESLERAGLSWGAARAAAHVGTELLLDGLLLDDAPTRDALSAATECLGSAAVAAAIRVDGRGAAHWPELVVRVRTRGTPTFYRSPTLVADRLVSILADRPRLAIEEGHREVLRRAMLHLAPDVERDAAALIAAARGGDPARARLTSVPSR